MALTRRKTTKSSGKPKEAPKPDTSIEKGSVNLAEKTAPMLGKCTKCKVMPAHCEVDHLCYDCRKTKAGYVYDEKTNRYIKAKEKK